MYEYEGKYIKEEPTDYGSFKWVVIPKNESYFLHNNALLSEMSMGVFEDDGVVYLMSYVFEYNNDYVKCGLANVKRSAYKTVHEPEQDKKEHDRGFIYSEMDSIYYCEYCNKYR